MIFKLVWLFKSSYTQPEKSVKVVASQIPVFSDKKIRPTVTSSQELESF